MKRLTLFFTISLMSALVYGQNLKALDEKNGFREYKFGIDTSAIPNLKLTETDNTGLTRFYEKTDEKLSIGDAEIESIAYGFYKGQFYSVLIKTKGYSNSKALLEMMRELYGKGYQSNQFIETYIWFGKLVNASYDENSITRDATVYFTSKSIQEQKKKDADERKKKAKGEM